MHNPDSAIKASEIRYRHLFENVPICIFVVDLTMSPATVLEVNRRAELIYGYTAAELVGNPATQLVSEESRASFENLIERVLQGEMVTTEITNRHRDGTPFAVRVTATLDPADSARMITTVEDIRTDKQRRTEAEAIEAERLRIAHEIHDGVAQNLAGIRLKSALWSLLADTASPEMRAALDELQAVLMAAIVDLRRAIFALRPMDLEALGFFPALTELIRDFGDQNQVAARLELSGLQTALPPVYELPLFRIIQEGLNNICHHARASFVLVHLAVDADGRVDLSLCDNGLGFDPSLAGAAVQSGHFGLHQMRERVLNLGGTLDVHSAIGQGTELLIRLPPVSKAINTA